MYPETYAHHLLLLFYPVRDEQELPSGYPSSYQNKRLEPGVQIVVNSNKIKFKPNGGLLDEAYSRYNVNMLDNQDPIVQIENTEKREAVYSNDQHDENTESNKNSAIPNGMPRIMRDDEILGSVNSLNSKQRNVFNVVHNWVKEYAKHKGINAKPVLICLSGSGGSGKFHLVKTIFNAVSKKLVFGLLVFSGESK